MGKRAFAFHPAVARGLSLLIVCFLIAGPGTLYAQYNSQPEESQLELFSHQNQAGVRLGGWISTGDDIPRETFEDPNSGESVEADINSGSFIAEAFYMYRAFQNVGIEFSFGLTNRGDVIRITPTDRGPIRDIGTLNLYPILLQVRLYAPFNFGSRMQMYISGGGGVYYGRNSIQISNDAYYAQFRESSDTDINFVAGAGLDYVLADQFALGLNAKYMPISFNDELLRAKDWSAATIAVSIMYLFSRQK